MQNYSWSVHELLQSPGKAPSLAYIQFWKYVIYLSAIKELAKLSDCPKPIKTAHKIINRIYTSPAPSIGELIGSKLIQVTRLKLPTGGFSLDTDNPEGINFEGGEISFADVKDDHSLQARLNVTLERLVDLFEETLSELQAMDTKVFISFDRVDEAF